MIDRLTTALAASQRSAVICQFGTHRPRRRAVPWIRVRPPGIRVPKSELQEYAGGWQDWRKPRQPGNRPATLTSIMRACNAAAVSNSRCRCSIRSSACAGSPAAPLAAIRPILSLPSGFQSQIMPPLERPGRSLHFNSTSEESVMFALALSLQSSQSVRR